MAAGRCEKGKYDLNIEIWNTQKYNDKHSRAGFMPSAEVTG